MESALSSVDSGAGGPLVAIKTDGFDDEEVKSENTTSDDVVTSQEVRQGTIILNLNATMNNNNSNNTISSSKVSVCFLTLEHF